MSSNTNDFLKIHKRWWIHFQPTLFFIWLCISLDFYFPPSWDYTWNFTFAWTIRCMNFNGICWMLTMFSYSSLELFSKKYSTWLIYMKVIILWLGIYIKIFNHKSPLLWAVIEQFIICTCLKVITSHYFWGVNRNDSFNSFVIICMI